MTGGVARVKATVLISSPCLFVLELIRVRWCRALCFGLSVLTHELVKSLLFATCVVARGLTRRLLYKPLVF